MLSKGLARIGKHSTRYILAEVIINVVQFLLIPVYTRFLTREDYGIISTTTVTFAVFQILLLFSLHGAVVRFFFDYRKREQDVRAMMGSYIIFTVVWSVMFGLGVFTFRDTLSHLLGIPFEPFIRFTFITGFIAANIRLVVSLLRAQDRSFEYLVLLLVQFALTTLVAVYLVVHGWGAYGVVTGQVIGLLLMCIPLLIYVSKTASFRFRPDILKSGLKFSLPLVPHNLSNWILTAADRILLNNMASLASTGLYSLGYNVGAVMRFITMGINQAWVPFFYDTLDKDPGKVSKTNIARIISYLTAGYFLCALGLSILGREVIILMADPKFHISYIVIPVIAASYSIRGMYFFAINQLSYIKKTTLIPVGSILAAIFNVFLNILLIPQLGYLGAALATAASNLAMLLLFLVFAQKNFPLPYEARYVMPILVFTFLTLGDFHFVEPLDSLPLRLLLKSGLILMYIIYIAFRYLDTEERVKIIEKAGLFFKKRRILPKG